jgi:hypothetical protein
MPRSNGFIYVFTATEIAVTHLQQLVGLLHFRMSLVLVAYSWGFGGHHMYQVQRQQSFYSEVVPTQLQSRM